MLSGCLWGKRLLNDYSNARTSSWLNLLRVISLMFWKLINLIILFVTDMVYCRSP